MRDFLRRLFPLDMYADALDRFQASGVYFCAAVMLIGLIGVALTDLVRLLMGQPIGLSMDVLLVVQGVILFGVCALVIALTRNRQHTLAATILVIAWLGGTFFLLLSTGLGIGNGVALALVGISLSALLIGERPVPYTVVATLVVFIANIFINPNAPDNLPRRVLTEYTSLIIISGVINYALVRAVRIVSRQTVQTNESRIRLAEASSTLSQKLLATRLDLNALLKDTVSLVREMFPDANEAQLYLVDRDRRNATLVATTRRGEQPGQQVGIGSLTVVGRVTITGQPIVVRETSEDRPYRRTALVAGIRTELALPLQAGGETIGVLDIQSRKSEAFAEDEVQTLTGVVNQIAVAIDNARLYAEAQSQLADNKRLFDQARNNLREIERLNQQLTGTAWAEYLRSQPEAPAYTIDLESGHVENAAEWTPTLADAARHNQITVRQTAQAKVIALPISVRGQAIGAMEFEIALEQDISPEQMAVLQQVVERLGLAAENTRLFEEAQRLAQREALVNEISARMQVTTNVEGVIAAATQSLADAFHAPRVAIRLGSPRK